MQCRCGKCSKALAGFEYQGQDLKTKHEKKYPPVSVPIPNRVSSVVRAKLPGVEDGANDSKQQQQDLDHNKREPLPARMNGRVGIELEEVRDNEDLDWDQDEHDFDFDYMRAFDDEELLNRYTARSATSPPQTPSPLLQNRPRMPSSPLQRPPRMPPHQNPPPPLLVDEIFEPLGDPGVPPPGSNQAQADRPNFLPIAFQETPAVRMAYLSAVMANVYGHLTIQQATNQLNNTLDGLLVAGVLPEHPRPVRTLVSA